MAAFQSPHYSPQTGASSDAAQRCPIAQAPALRYKTSMDIPTFSSILITGGSSGIGRALATELAKPGVRITLTGRDQNRLNDAVQACRAKGADVEGHVLDVTDSHALAQLIDAADKARPLDLVIANAGISGGAGSDAKDADQTQRIIDINITGVINTVLPAVDAMRTHGRGRIGIVSSLAGFRGMPTAPAYSASKVAVKAWGDAIRPGLAKDGIGLSMIYPGFVESRITDANDFPMPMLMKAPRAAEIIHRGLADGKRAITFPWPMVLMMRLLSALPGPLFDALLARAPKKG